VKRALVIALLLAAAALAADAGVPPRWKDHPPKWKRFDGGSWPPGDDSIDDW
jgi:hypothetical protein